VLVGGKGGVGKTTCAAAIAFRSAHHCRTLLVSTDPAASVRRSFGFSGRPARLDVRAIDARAAFRAWLAPREDLLAAIAVRGTYLDEDDVHRLLALSLPGIDEVAALLEIVRLSESRYERVVVDTAPTGHTLRLLAMPVLAARMAEVLDGLQLHHRGVVRALTGRYREDAADRLIASLAEDSTLLTTRLRDERQSEFVWVTLPEPMALEETADALTALAASRIRVRTLIVNRATPRGGCEWDAARRRFEARALAPIAACFPAIRVRTVAESETEPRNAAALRSLASTCSRAQQVTRPSPLRRRLYGAIAHGIRTTAVGKSIFDARWLLVSGKGGVGKTTCGAALAVDLARASPNESFLLLSTDPAHSLGDVLGVRVSDSAAPLAGGLPNLDVREIDAARGLQQFRARYTGAVDAMFDGLTRSTLDPTPDRSALRELIEFTPPGLDEVIAIAEVAELLNGRGSYRTIVTDTAPTGHALRLLETPAILREWTQALMAILLKYREIVRPGAFAQLLVDLSQRLRALDTIVRDRNQTAFVIVTRAAAVPREETLALQRSLDALGVAVRAVIVNAFGAGSCPRCRSIEGRQRRELGSLRAQLADRGPYAIIVTPSALPPPHGVDVLQAWRSRWRAVN
jgi:arsenite-transporting ATPase